MSDFDLGYRDPLWARLEEKDAEIDRLKGQVDVRDAVISKLSGTVAEWRPYLTRAADALEDLVWKERLHQPLIDELREAAE
jgi:hypothetical protein